MLLIKIGKIRGGGWRRRRFEGGDCYLFGSRHAEFEVLLPERPPKLGFSHQCRKELQISKSISVQVQAGFIGDPFSENGENRPS